MMSIKSIPSLAVFLSNKSSEVVDALKKESIGKLDDFIRRER